jgi:hypothetical protein
MSSLLPQDIVEPDNRPVVYAGSIRELVGKEPPERAVEFYTQLYESGLLKLEDMWELLGLDSATLPQVFPEEQPSMASEFIKAASAKVMDPLRSWWDRYVKSGCPVSPHQVVVGQVNENRARKIAANAMRAKERENAEKSSSSG